MNLSSETAHLTSRSVVSVRGEDWRGFLQGLLTNDVEALGVGEAQFAALLTPQGRVLFDLFVVGMEDGCLLDVAAERRDEFVQRLGMYRLRAKVEIEASDTRVFTQYSAHPREGGDPSDGEAINNAADSDTALGSPPSRGRADLGVWISDPRLAALGLRGYGVFDATTDEPTYDAHRLALGVPSTADWGYDRSYPIEADFDLLNGIDFQKGCFVGQETTSRMKRRGTIKSRMLPINFDGPPPAHGSEILAGTLRAGEVLSGLPGRAMALVRLDRIEGADLTVDDRPVRVETPYWFPT